LNDTGRAGAVTGATIRRLICLAGGLLAAVVSVASMLGVRWLLHVRTIPERLMEWFLLFVPLEVFEAGIQRFGFDAKRYALYGAFAGMLAALTGVGTVALSRRWPVPALALLSTGLWLFVMVALLPLTGAGVFALDLLDGTKAAIGGYFAVSLTYAASAAARSSTLIIARSSLVVARDPGHAGRGSRAAPRPACTFQFN
jgi:hypothetical protein